MNIMVESRKPVQSFLLEAGKEHCLEFSFPIRDIQCYWHSGLRTPSQKIHWRIPFSSSGVCNIPFIAFFNTGGINRISIMADTLDDDCFFFFRMNQQLGVYEAEIKITPQTDCSLTIDSRKMDWQKTLAEYRSGLKLPVPKIPEAAWNPVFCTWYAAHTGVSEQWLEENCRIASELGFGTLIVDDGWSFDTVKRHCPELIDTWYSEIGDWQVSAKKFPDFVAHIRRVREMGLRYMLWTAPFILGAKSNVLKELETGDYDEKRVDGACWLLPHRKKVRDLIIEKLTSLMRNYPVDGLKIDYLDYFMPDISHPKGRMMRAFARELSRKIREVKPDALIEYRQNYTVPGMLEFATQYRAGDVPYDWMDNFNRLAQMRTLLGDKLTLHADPAFWREDEPLVNIGRHMIAALAGVPMLSMELTRMPEDQKTVIRTFLALYREYRDFWKQGCWHIEYELGNVISLTVELDGRRIVFVNSAYFCPEDAELVLNLSHKTLKYHGLAGFDAQGKPADGIPPGGFGRKFF